MEINLKIIANTTVHIGCKKGEESVGADQSPCCVDEVDLRGSFTATLWD